MGDLHEWPALPDTIPSLNSEQADWLATQLPKSRYDHRLCVTCKGTGQFRWYEGPEAVDYRCPCLDQWKLSRYLWWSGVGLAYQRNTWIDLVTDGPERLEPIEKVMAYVESGYAERVGRSLLMIGPPGTGKTLLATLVLKRLLAQGLDGYFTSFGDLVSALISSWSDEDYRRHYNHRFRNAGALVIDDPGTELKARGGDTHETPRFVFESIVRHRTAEGLPTIITTNIDSVDEMARRYGANLRSLLMENTEEVRFTGSDWRARQHDRVGEEIDRGLQRPITLR